jgi:hypothetical protein
MYEGWISYDWPAMIGTKTRRNITSGETARDACLAAIQRSESAGKLTELPDGTLVVEFPWSNTRWAQGTAVSRPTLIKAKKNLIAEGLLVEVHKPGDRKNPHTYALLIGKQKPLTTKGEGPDINRTSEENPDEETPPVCGKRFVDLPRDLPPRLRWSSGGFKPKRGTVPGTSKVRTTPPRPAISPRKRLGKAAGAILDHLVVLGGATTHAQLLKDAHLTRAQADKPLAQLEEFRVIAREPAEHAEDVSVLLTHEWRAALTTARRITGEQEATARERERMRERAQQWAQQQRDWSYVQRQRKRRQSGPWKPPTDAQRVDALVRAGMGRRHAAREVYGDDPPHGPACACPECY